MRNAMNRSGDIRSRTTAQAIVMVGLVMGFSTHIWAAQTSLSVSGASGVPGSNVTLALSLANATGLSPAAIQWDLEYASSDLSLAQGSYYATGGAAAAAGKSAICQMISAGDIRCLVAGLSAETLGPGVLATIQFEIAPTTTNQSTQVSLVNSQAADESSNALAISGSGATIIIGPRGVPGAVSVSPSSGSGLGNSFALQYSDTDGAANLEKVYAYFNATLANPASNSCFIYYSIATNQINLLNDTSTEYLTATLGTTTTLQNSQCSLNVAATTVAMNGNTLTLNVAMTFKVAYAGVKNIYLYATDASGATSGWQTEGTWTVPSGSGTPAAVSATPSSGSLASQNFVLRYSDTAGASNLQLVYAYFNATLANPAVNTCLLYYNVATNQINVLNDMSTAYLTATLGTATTLQNSQCSVNVATTTVALTGNSLTLNLSMSFKPAFAGTKNIYTYARDVSGASSGWQTEGTWTVPVVLGTPAAVSVTPNSGSVASQNFQLQYSDTAGASNLQLVYVYFNATLANPATNSCFLYYNVASHRINLLNDGSTAYSSATPGTATTLQNSQCSLNVAATTATPSGNGLTLNLAMMFTPGYAGAKSIYMYATDISGTDSGWESQGTWTVP